MRREGDSELSTVGRQKAIQRVGRRMRVGPTAIASNQHDMHEMLDPLLASRGYEGKKLLVCLPTWQKI